MKKIYNYRKFFDFNSGIYESMKRHFYLVSHDYQKNQPEQGIFQSLSDNTFEKRIVSLDKVVNCRNKNQNAAIVLVASHLSHADYLETVILFYSNNIKLLIQAGDNLFIENVKIKIPKNYFIEPDLDINLNLDKYLRSSGTFKVLRKPVKEAISDLSEFDKKRKVFKLNKAYIFELVKNSEMFSQFPSQSLYMGKIN